MNLNELIIYGTLFIAIVGLPLLTAVGLFALAISQALRGKVGSAVILTVLSIWFIALTGLLVGME